LCSTIVIYGAGGSKYYSQPKRKKKVSRSGKLAQSLKTSYEENKGKLIVRHPDGREYEINKEKE